MTDPTLTGKHTQEKLGVLSEYLEFYSKALQGKNFVLAYIDAFAGSGTLSKNKAKIDEDDFFYQEYQDDEVIEERPGSASLALAVEPPLEHLIFIERSKSRADKLKKLQSQHPDRNIRVYQEDANTALTDLCKRVPWRGADAPGYGIRAVAFLDPYGMQMDWTTLEAIAATKAIDVWYLFPTYAVLRQATNDAQKIDAHKKRSLDRLLGGDWWRTEFYEEVPDLFATPNDGNAPEIRKATAKDVELAFSNKLKKLFNFVHSEPLQIDYLGRHYFSLFFAVSNPSVKAIALARKGADHLLKDARVRGIHSMSGLYKSGQ